MEADAKEKALLLAFDVGNTTVRCAVREEGRWKIVFTCPTCPVEALSERVRGAVPESFRDGVRGARCVVSSVCPPADGFLRRYWAESSAGGPEFFGRDLAVPIETLVEESGKVGVDRLLCAVGAKALAASPCIVVGAGTAITVDLVDAEGRFAGGAIAPGFLLAARALSDGAACLPHVGPGRPMHAAGRNTAEAIRSGVYWSCRGGVAALVAELKGAVGDADTPVVCTGGDAELLRGALPGAQMRFEPLLIFLGISEALRVE